MGREQPSKHGSTKRVFCVSCTVPTARHNAQLDFPLLHPGKVRDD
jgi:hypothetical protein